MCIDEELVRRKRYTVLVKLRHVGAPPNYPARGGHASKLNGEWGGKVCDRSLSPDMGVRRDQFEFGRPVLGSTSCTPTRAKAEFGWLCGSRGGKD